MKHYATTSFWYHYRQLPEEVQRIADEKYRMLENNPYHPSLHFKKIHNDLWSARIGLEHRAVATPENGAFLWFWIGPHDEYEELIF
ncbi:MAG: hypothetical protein BRD42_06640 [Bacteroidetes bacterium QS_3_64_15]|nr:MAG: hypothetical protein BRD42_06640 [Bacteroidetes bacterium QS_3_64_15]